MWCLCSMNCGLMQKVNSVPFDSSYFFQVLKNIALYTFKHITSLDVSCTLFAYFGGD
jgi:hypothetical protein